MNLKFKISIALLLVFFSCAEMKNNLNETTFDIPYEANNNFFMLSKYFKSINFLPLETNKESVIGDITKLKIIKNRIYIFDKIGNSILVFNNYGKFEKKISAKGVGPGEYVSIINFDVENDDLYILDITRKIHHYKNDLYVKSQKTDFMSTDFCITKEGFIFKILSFKKEYNQFVATSKDLQTKNWLLPTSNLNSNKTAFNWGGSNNFATNNSKIYFSPNYSSSVYELDNEKHTTKYLNKLDFGSKNLPHNSNLNNYDITSTDFQYVVRRNFFFYKNYIILDFFYNRALHIDWIDTTADLHNVGIPKNDINEVPFIPSWGFDNGLVGFMDIASVINDKGLMTNDKLKNIKAGDNPVLMIYTYKD